MCFAAQECEVEPKLAKPTQHRQMSAQQVHKSPLLTTSSCAYLLLVTFQPAIGPARRLLLLLHTPALHHGLLAERCKDTSGYHAESPTEPTQVGKSRGVLPNLCAQKGLSLCFFFSWALIQA